MRVRTASIWSSSSIAASSRMAKMGWMGSGGVAVATAAEEVFVDSPPSSPSSLLSLSDPVAEAALLARELGFCGLYPADDEDEEDEDEADEGVAVVGVVVAATAAAGRREGGKSASR